MAPPPNTTAQSPASLQERLLQLVQTLQFAWFTGHVILLLSTLRYGLSYITFNYYSRWAQFSYRAGFVSAAVTYGIVVYKGVRAQARQPKGQQKTPLQLLGDENVDYLLMAIVWLFSKQVPLALLPFTVYSIFHVATYTRSALLPILSPQPQGKSSGLADTIGRFVKDNYDSSMTLVALLEVLLVLRLSLSAILFQKGSWILLGIYAVFLRVRYSQSSFMQSALAQLGARIDGVVGQQNVPPAARNVWLQIKNGLRVVADSTPVERFLSARPQPTVPKKAQ